DRDLPRAAAAALAREDEVAAVGGPGRILAAAAALGDLADLPRGQVDDRDVEPYRARLQAGGVGDLAVLLGRVPGRGLVPVADSGQPADVEALAVHQVDLRRARAVRGERDLLARRAPGGRGVAARRGGDAVGAGAIGVGHPDLHVAGLVARVRDALAVGRE